MNLGTITFAYLRAHPWNTVLILLLLALGMGTITLLLLVSSQLEERMGRDAQGIDLVVGAKGSPLQLVLSAVYHLDVPTGNIALSEAMALAKRKPLVRQVIPLSLGDTHAGFRIVGTEPSFFAHYGAPLAEGRPWGKSMEVVLGADAAARTGLRAGARFTGSHGLEAAGAHHDAHPYTVVGVLGRTGSVIDRLIVTSLDSVWDVHAREDVPQGEPPPMNAETREITALLVKYGSPLAVLQLPRFVNTQTAMQAASPAMESVRLFTLLGVGFDVVKAFAFVLIVSAGLSVFVALYNALRERRYDLAIMRTLGCSRGKILRLMMIEGLMLALAGTALGIVLGHGLTEVLGALLAARQQISVTGLHWLHCEFGLFALGAMIGLLAAVIPAIFAYRSDISRTLAAG